MLAWLLVFIPLAHISNAQFRNPIKIVTDKLSGKERKWTDKQKKEAATAETLFRLPSGASAIENSTEPIYNPINTKAAQEMKARFEAVNAKYKNKKSLTQSEQQELAEVITPFLRYAEANGITEDDLKQTATKANQTGSLQIPPRSQVVVKLKTVCQDINAPAPQPGEKMHLVPSSDLMPKEFQEIYKALFIYSHNNNKDEQKQAQIQRITWNLRHGCFKDKDSLTAMRLQPADETLLDELLPNGAKFVKDKCKKFNVKILLKDLALATLEGGGRLDINPAGLADANASVVRVLRAQTQTRVDEPIPNNNSDYSLLQEGVAVRSNHTKNSASETEIIINNATDQPATFTPDEWSLESNRPVQRLGIVGIEGAAVWAIIGAVAVAAIIAAMIFSRGLLGGGMLAGLIRGFIRPGRGIRPIPGGTVGGTRPPTTPSIRPLTPPRPIGDMSRAASVADRNGLTKAGRAYQKHMDRPGSSYPTVSPKNTQTLNTAGQRNVDSILNNSGTVFRDNRFGGIDAISPNGTGVRYNGRGEFMGFLEP